VNEIDAIPVDDEEIDAIPVDEPIDAISATPKERELKVQRPPASRPEAFVTRAGRAVSGGLTEPVSAAITAGLLDKVPDKEEPTFAEKYEFARQLQTERQKRIGKERPLAATAGTLTGTGLMLASPMGAKGMAALGGLTGAAEGEGVTGRLAGGAAGALLPAGLSKLPGVVQAALPVGASVYDLATAAPGADTLEALANLALSVGTTGTQAVRGVKRFLSSRGEKAGEQLLSSEGARLSAARQKELEDAAAAVASADARRRQLTGEQQTRLANAPRLEEAGGRMGFAPAPPELLPPEAVPEAQLAYESFFRNAPEKFTEEAARVAAQQAEARAAQTATETKWTDPVAVAEAMRTVGPVTPGPVPPDLEAADRVLQQRELTAARSRVPEEIKGAAKERVVASMLGGIPFGLLTDASAAGAAKGMLAGAAGRALYGSTRKIQQLLATDPKTKLFKDPAAANVIYDAIPAVVRKFPSLAKYASLATDAGIRARPAFLMLALQRDPDFARALEEEVPGETSAP
jgi:hypothetical protein